MKSTSPTSDFNGQSVTNGKRTVKIKFIDYWSTLPEELDGYLVMQVLRKHYNVEICDDADYVFYSVMGESHWSVPDRCLKIFCTGENVAPDFNACDYAVGFEWMDYEDRYIRFPNYLFYGNSILPDMEHKHELPENWDLKTEKTGFCSFVVSNHRNKGRNAAFHALCQYKKVDSGGRYLNNIGEVVQDKLAFERKHKFSLCFENGAHSGYTTEKLVQAFAARTVPIYWGDPNVGKVFNKKAFVDASDFRSMEELIARIRQIDEDDELYLSMLREPALLPATLTKDEEYARFEAWLLNIFEQPLEQAYRRNREMYGRWYIERRFCLSYKDNWKAILNLYKEKFHKGIAYIKKRYLHKE